MFDKIKFKTNYMTDSDSDEVSAPKVDCFLLRADPTDKLKSSISKIDRFYYINLKKRPDRKRQTEAEMNRVGIPKEKRTHIVAVDRPHRPALGCTESHMKIMEDINKNGYEICVILEDDVIWTNNHISMEKLLTTISQTINRLQLQWHVVMLGGRIQKKQEISPNLHRVEYGVHSHAYMIHRSAIPSLLKNLKKSQHLLKTHGYLPKRAMDVQWTDLQKESSMWYVAVPNAFGQRAGYSDITHRKMPKRN